MGDASSKKKYLDRAGVAYLWSKIVAELDEKPSVEEIQELQQASEWGELGQEVEKDGES